MDGLLTAIAGFTQLILIVMGAYVSLRPQKERHWRWIGAFIGVGMVGVGVTVSLAQRASNAQEAANVQISKAVTAATNANTAATNANNSVLEEQKEVKRARDDAKAANDQLAQLIIKTSGQVTGGDTVCYLDIPGEQIPLSSASLRKRGQQPLYDVNATLWIGHSFPGADQGQAIAQTQALRIGNLPEGDRPSFGNISLVPFNLKDQRAVDFIVAFSAKNGSWHELMYLRRIGEFGPGGKWLKAMRVYKIHYSPEPYRRRRQTLAFEQIDQGFPMEGIDWTDWLSYSN
jgi:hypothetical protein